MRSEAGEPLKTVLCAQAGEALPLICAGSRDLRPEPPQAAGLKLSFPCGAGADCEAVGTLGRIRPPCKRVESAACAGVLIHSSPPCE